MAAKFAGYVNQPHIVGHGPTPETSRSADTTVRPRPVWRQQRVESPEEGGGS
jgi:hypothetical protein